MPTSDLLLWTCGGTFLLLGLAALVWTFQRALAYGKVAERLQVATRDIAVAQEKLSHLAELRSALVETEYRLQQAQSARYEAEAGRAKADEALQHVTQTLSATSARLGAHESARLEVAVAARDAALSYFQAEIAQLRARLATAESERDSAEQAQQALTTSLATLRETLAQERCQSEERLRLHHEARGQLGQEFERLATQVMQQHGIRFQQQNISQFDALLGPLRERLGAFEAGLRAAQHASAVERATLGEQIRQLLQQGDRMTTETTNLTRALKGQSQAQGAWGEMILSSVLERSGLLKDQHYVVQAEVADDEGFRLRPDVTVKMPGAPLLVIDAKVSLVAFEAYVNAETAVAGSVHLEAHARSIRGHIQSLASKDYHAAVQSPVDYVIMFVPIEGALAAALNYDADLVGFAMEQGVTLATPTTLMIALRTVANVWRVEHRNENAAMIATEAGRLYDKLVGFVEDMEEIGRRLGQAQTGYSAAMSKLSEGRGNLLARAEQLKRRGAKTAKSLPESRVDEAEVALLATESS
jgi:DNA recombination protein RmuC